MAADNVKQEEVRNTVVEPIDRKHHERSKELILFFASYGQVPKHKSNRATKEGVSELTLYNYFRKSVKGDKDPQLYEALKTLQETERLINKADDTIMRLEQFCKENDGVFPTETTTESGRSIARAIKKALLDQNGYNSALFNPPKYTNRDNLAPNCIAACCESAQIAVARM